MRSFTKFSLRFAIYLLIISYISADIFLFHGPFHKHLHNFRKEYTPSPDIVARVFSHEISRSQLDRAILENLWLTGKNANFFNGLPSDQRALYIYAALSELIEHEILRTKITVNASEVTPTDQEINNRFNRLSGLFDSPADLDTALQSQGIPNRESLRKRIASRIQQEKYIALRVNPLVTVSEDEISTYYQDNLPSLKIPERIRARHIFIATLNTPPETAKQTLQNALKQINSNPQTFSSLAKSISTDPATNSKGGDLGWMSPNRLPQDFVKATFPLPINNPTLIQTKLGWHIIEVTDRKPAHTPTLESLRQEIHSAIATAKRHKAVTEFRKQLREFEKNKIHIYHQNISPNHILK